LLGLLLCLAMVPTLKQFSTASCPYELSLFGGVATYVPHWRPGVADGGPGHCFPSGHAVSALAFMGLYFGWRERWPRAGRAPRTLAQQPG
jgi:membrane-associated PAP2 superfamily phosphatase